MRDEALQILQGEGLVVIEHNRGARVRLVDAQRLVHIFDVREALESFLTATFAQSASPHQVEVLEAIKSQHDDAVSRIDFGAAFDTNSQFHRLINGASRNWDCLAFVDTLKLCLQGALMPKTRLPYAPEFRRQMIELVRAGGNPEDLAREFEPTSQSIRNWVAQADRREGRREEKVEPTSSAERDELIKLRREVRQLRLERSEALLRTLSKAAAPRARRQLT